MKNEYLIKMIDGGILNIETDNESYAGCDTCDYGSKYINYITITMSQYILTIEITNEYGYALSVENAMHIFLRKHSDIECLYEKEFKSWFKKELKQISNFNKYRDKMKMR